ncbi:MAG: DUF1553 domain-containing protein [Bacteroidetes bacterium]|nr:DUF1553 domain-containing protein [Fibrella sp.]
MPVWSTLPFRYALLTATTGLFGASIWLTACNRLVDKPAEIVAAEVNLPKKIDYNLHIKPILSDRCFVCHGPDVAKQQAGLRLDTPEGAYEALAESGKRAIVPGNVGGSELFHRIISTDPDYVMPTPESNLSLNAEEKAMLLRWVEQGAEYQEHWSLIAPTDPTISPIENDTWSRNDIDRLVLTKQKEKKLNHAPEADKATLLRRVTLDLTGLPPSPAEVDAFLADKSPLAYEKVVNRLLNSPHYGERQAVEWLDVARYADTHGYQDDGLRTMWPYRDWVIRAFNRNLSFDRFVTWQLAGDLLPNPNRDQLIATAFNRNHQQSQEGGIVPEEYLQEYIADRTATFGKAMLGLTVECARCHDHKYDPISQKDYYALGAFFAQNNEHGQIPYNGEPSPHITLPTPEAEAQLKFIREKIHAVDTQQTTDRNAGAKARFATWLAQARRDPAKAVQPEKQDLLVHVPFDQYADRPADTPKKDGKGKLPTEKATPAKKAIKTMPAVAQKPRIRRVFTNMVNDTLPLETQGDLDAPIPLVKGAVGQGVRLVGESYLELRNVKTADKKDNDKRPLWFERNQPFTVGLWVNIDNPTLEGRLFNRNEGPFNGYRGYECVRLKDGRLAFRLSYVWPDDAIDVETVDKLPLNRWSHLTMAYDGTSRADGLHIYVNGQPARVRVVTNNLTQSIIFGKKKSSWGGGVANLGIGQLHDQNYKGYAVDELRVYGRKLTPLEVRSLVSHRDELQLALRAPQPATGPDAQMAALFDYFVTNVDRPSQERRLVREQQLGQETRVMNEQDVDVMVMRERKYPRPTHLLNRGAYDAPGETVTPEVLHSLKPMPQGMPKNRLGLANWLTMPEHPLFARVMVNRVWQQYFGQGLAKNSDDFGNQGALPSHPELLDYLAVRFRAGTGQPGTAAATDPWNMKALHKLIVMSATYRQSSAVSEQARESDPDNTFLTRGASYRMSAEQVRDNALAASGLLTRRIGGRSVHPYQPAGIWEALATRNTVNYVQNHGDSLYRRSMYTIWKRSSPPPMMLNFDAAERHTCIVKRQKTSTPLQALVTLNDPQFLEAARVLAQRVAGQASLARWFSPNLPRTEKPSIGNANAGQQALPNEVVQATFKAVVSRPARPEEVSLMQQLYAEELVDFRKNPKRAQALLAVGEYPADTKQNPAELAALTVMTSTIMNFDEAIIKR